MASGRFAEGQRQSPPPLGQTLFELKIRTLRKQMLGAARRESASAQRRLELAHSAANAYVPAMPGVRKDPARLATCKALAAAIFPERHAQ